MTKFYKNLDLIKEEEDSILEGYFHKQLKPKKISKSTDDERLEKEAMRHKHRYEQRKHKETARYDY